MTGTIEGGSTTDLEKERQDMIKRLVAVAAAVLLMTALPVASDARTVQLGSGSTLDIPTMRLLSNTCYNEPFTVHWSRSDQDDELDMTITQPNGSLFGPLVFTKYDVDQPSVAKFPACANKPGLYKYVMGGAYEHDLGSFGIEVPRVKAFSTTKTNRAFGQITWSYSGSPAPGLKVKVEKVRHLHWVFVRYAVTNRYGQVSTKGDKPGIYRIDYKDWKYSGVYFVRP